MIDHPNTDERRGWTSASNAEADSLCPGRHQAQKGMPEVSGDYADRGTAIHRVLATEEGALTTNLAVEDRETFEACREQERALVNQFFGEGAAVKVIRERRFWGRVKTPTGFLEHSAKPDVVYYQGTKALALEYKTLYGDIPASPTNLQLRDQACLVAANLLCVEVGVAVIQPRVAKDIPEICLYLPESIKVARDQMRARIIASNSPDAPRVAGQVQCKWCRAKGSCPAYEEFARATLTAMESPPALVTLAPLPLSQWTPEMRAIFLEGEAVAREWLEETKSALKDMLKADPKAIPGWTLRKGVTREKIINAQACFERFVVLAKEQGIETSEAVDQFMGCVDISKGLLRDRLSSVTKKRGKALDGAMTQITEGIVEAKQLEPSIIREKDHA